MGVGVIRRVGVIESGCYEGVNIGGYGEGCYEELKGLWGVRCIL